MDVRRLRGTQADRPASSALHDGGKERGRHGGNRKIRRSVRLVPEGDARVGRPLLIAARFRRKAKGLLFSPEHAGALLLAPCNDVQLRRACAIALDIASRRRAGLVLEAHRDVGLCRRLRNKSAEAVVERFVLRDPVVHGGRSRGSGLHERRSEMKTCPTCGPARLTTPRCASAARIATGGARPSERRDADDAVVA